MKTSELTDLTLDWAVGQCAYDTKVIVEDGFVYFTSDDGYRTGRCNPSTNPAQGQPILERAGISIRRNHRTVSGWEAYIYSPGKWDESEHDSFEHYQVGPTALIAGLRCFVASRLGDEVEIPKELT